MSDDANDESLSVNTARLETIAKAAQSRADARKWRSQKDGTLGLGEPSGVRSLTTDETAKAEAEGEAAESMARWERAKRRRGYSLTLA
jgi:hypothetical protein